MSKSYHYFFLISIIFRENLQIIHWLFRVSIPCSYDYIFLYIFLLFTFTECNFIYCVFCLQICRQIATQLFWCRPLRTEQLGHLWILNQLLRPWVVYTLACSIFLQFFFSKWTPKHAYKTWSINTLCNLTCYSVFFFIGKY